MVIVRIQDIRTDENVFILQDDVIVTFQTKMIIIEEFSAAAVKIMLIFLYTGSVCPQELELEVILHLPTFFLIGAVKAVTDTTVANFSLRFRFSFIRQCDPFMSTFQDASDVMQLAEKYNIPALKTMCEQDLISRFYIFLSFSCIFANISVHFV